MVTERRRSLLRWASAYVVTAERAGIALFVMAAVLLVVAFCLPWWSVSYAGILVVNRTVTTWGFSGWAWLSFAAGLALLTLTVRFIAARGMPPTGQFDNRGAPWVIAAAGLAEILGNVLFVVAAPKTEVFISVGEFATRGVGLTIAMVAGGMLIVSGLVLAVSIRQAHVSAAPSAQSTLVG
ncbi:MAG: hypothetical protein ABSG36_13470 [Acidimicrobiales bacterium]